MTETLSLIELLNAQDTSVAIVGATDNPSKFGSRIYRDLKNKGFTLFAVNPNRETVDGDPAYSSLGDLPHPPTIVTMVVPASVGLRVLDDAAAVGGRNIWLQPGADSPELVERLAADGFSYVVDRCVMVEGRQVS